MHSEVRKKALDSRGSIITFKGIDEHTIDMILPPLDCTKLRYSSFICSLSNFAHRCNDKSFNLALPSQLIGSCEDVLKAVAFNGMKSGVAINLFVCELQEERADHPFLDLANNIATVKNLKALKVNFSLMLRSIDEIVFITKKLELDSLVGSICVLQDFPLIDFSTRGNKFQWYKIV